MYIRKTVKEDIERVSEIYAAARKFMRESGNPDQWPDGYPGLVEIESDIERGLGYVCCDGDEIVAVFHYAVGVDPTYVKIYDGEWKNDLPYAVIHRIAVARQGAGVAEFIFKHCFALLPNIKIDTHRNNLPMQRCLRKNGFEYCGIIYIDGYGERMAYQKTK